MSSRIPLEMLIEKSGATFLNLSTIIIIIIIYLLFLMPHYFFDEEDFNLEIKVLRSSRPYYWPLQPNLLSEMDRPEPFHTKNQISDFSTNLDICHS